MMVSHALEILAPLVDLHVLIWHRSDTVLSHKRMRCGIHSMHIKFFFQQSIHKSVDVERRPRRSSNADPVVEVEAARAFEKKLDPRSANLEWLVGLRIEQSSRFCRKCLSHLGISLIATGF